MELLSSFVRARVCAASVISLSFPALRCCFRAPLHFVRSAARPSQDIVSMSIAFISLTQTSLYRRWGRPVVPLPNASSPYRMYFEMRPSSIRRTWPNHRRLRCLSRVYILGRPARGRTSALVTLSSQDMPRIRRMLLWWNVVNLLSCPAYVVHVSLPYSNVQCRPPYLSSQTASEQGRSLVWRHCGFRMSPRSCHWTALFPSCQYRKTRSCSAVWVGNRSLGEP